MEEVEVRTKTVTLPLDEWEEIQERLKAYEEKRIEVVVENPNGWETRERMGFYTFDEALAKHNRAVTRSFEGFIRDAKKNGRKSLAEEFFLMDIKKFLLWREYISERLQHTHFSLDNALWMGLHELSTLKVPKEEKPETFIQKVKNIFRGDK